MDHFIESRRAPLALSRGYLLIHSAPTALCRHVEWAVSNLLGDSITLTWRPQPLLPGTHRTVAQWHDRAGLGGELASALRLWHYLRFEIREEAVAESVLYRATPSLGIHRAVVDGAGSILITENQIMSALKFNEDLLKESLERALGLAWDLELEQFRGAEIDSRSTSQAM